MAGDGDGCAHGHGGRRADLGLGRRERAAGIAHWGLNCVVCGFNFAETCEPAAMGYIHVHHLRPLASIGAAYVLDPVVGRRPVCPNCDAVIHLRAVEPYGIEEVRRMMVDAWAGAVALPNRGQTSLAVHGAAPYAVARRRTSNHAPACLTVPARCHCRHSVRNIPGKE